MQLCCSKYVSNILPHVTMEPQQFHRRVYNNAPVGGAYTISAIKFARFKEGEEFRTYNVNNINEYESGCYQHPQCFGHMCKTPDGIVLLPQSMSMRTMEIATEYHLASKFAFASNKTEYLEKLKETNYTKHGTYRIIMSTPVAGSGRLIATPQWEFGRDHIAISENLASRMKICRKVYSDNGEVGGKYIETNLKEGDWVITVRPPSLHFGNTQPMKVKFWNKDCIGIHPETFSMFHGDFDGDEVHIYPVYDINSIAECESWDILPMTSFQIGRKRFNDECIKLNFDNGLLDKDDDNNGKFLEYTTLSAKQIRENSYKLVLGEYSRNKDKHITGFSNRFISETTADSFVYESIRGQEDVKRQQLSQGNLGDMTRISKIVSSCFFRPRGGSLYVKHRTGNQLLSNDLRKDVGTPSVRGLASICALAQQAALDAHRAEDSTSMREKHDFISDLVLGCYRKVHLSPTYEYTYIELSFDGIDRSALISLAQSCSPRWIDDQRLDVLQMLCKPKDVKSNVSKYITTAYNPEILTLASRQNSIANLRGICENGIKLICNYYNIHISEIEMHDVSIVFSYRPDASIHPITTRDGMMSREIGWIETFEATDYTKLPSLEGDFEIPDTSTAAMFTSNFNNLKIKHEDI